MTTNVERILGFLLLTGALCLQASAQDDKPAKMPKNSNIDDIGTRDINKGSINFTSIQKEIELGRQLAAQVERDVKLLKDPVVTEYVNRIGQNLVRNSDAKVPFTIKVIDSDEINAFALPGGFFYVNTGLILAADEEAELAAVMGHEIAHVCARHGTENAAKGQIASIATIPLIMMGGPLGMGLRQASQLVIPLQFLQFSRANEAEADYLGLQYMYKAGYDPTAFVSMFEKLQVKETASPQSVSKLFATHPATADRIAETKKHIEQILPDRDEYVVTTSEFSAVKARLTALQDTHNPLPPDNGRPTLKRSTVGDRQGPTTKKDDKGVQDPKDTADPNPDTNDTPPASDDGRPTLKRHP